MPFDIFLLVSVVAIVLILGWPSRSINPEQQWRERNDIKPMSKEDIRINAMLAKRRRK